MSILIRYISKFRKYFWNGTFSNLLVLSFCVIFPIIPAVSQVSICKVKAIGDGNFVHFGYVSLETRKNAGDIANIGIIVGLDAVAVIDTGGSVTVGTACLAAIGKITNKPIRYVINTHEHPDHIFGNAAFSELGAIFVGSHTLPTSIREHGNFYLKSFRDILGNKEISKIKLIEPTLLVKDRIELDLGERKLLLTAWSDAHSDSDLMVLDEHTHTLFGGDLVFMDHVPVIDGSLKGWLALLPAMASIPATRVVPGHGQHIAPWPQALDDERRYLESVRTDVRRLIAKGTPLAEAVPLIGLSERNKWKLFDDYNPRNATAAFSEYEWEQ